MARRRKAGKRFSRLIPYGYQLASDGESLIPHQTERGVIITARTLRRAGYSLRKISAALADSGHYNRNNKPFCAASIKRILESDWSLDDE